jgi:hypothetical protein
MAKPPKKKQRNSVKMRVRTPVEIPWNSKKGTQFVFRRDGQIVGEMLITGSHVFVRSKNKQTWREYEFDKFIDRLT